MTNEQTKLEQKRQDWRRRAQTDLYWLAKDILGYDLVPHVHKPVCDLFIHKDPSRPFADQDDVKQRLLLDPRGHFKTTLDICDIIQWILCFPDTRILVMSGTRELAQRMNKEIKYHFQYNQLFRELFPEHCPKKKVGDFGTADGMTTLARTHLRLREPTVSISTIDSVKAGSHYDIIKCDDLVNETNVATKDQIEKTIQAFHYTTPILEPHGYRDVIGTRYDFSDLYGHILDSDPDSWRVHMRPAWRKTKLTGAEVEYDILFPERFTLEKLKTIQKENPYLFNCQYLNNPIPGESHQFPEKLMRDHFMPFAGMPKPDKDKDLDFRTFVCWDLGFSTGVRADYTVGAVGAFDWEGRLFILDIVRGRYLPHELVNAIIATTRKYKPVFIGIEEAGGSRLLLPALEAKARELRIHLPIQWLRLNYKKNSKEARIGALEGLLRQNKLYFINGMEHQDALIEEFARFPKFVHDDIPDAIAMLVENYRSKVEIPYRDEEIEVTGVPSTSWALGPELGAGLIG